MYRISWAGYKTQRAEGVGVVVMRSNAKTCNGELGVRGCRDRVKGNVYGASSWNWERISTSRFTVGRTHSGHG